MKDLIEAQKTVILKEKQKLKDLQNEYKKNLLMYLDTIGEKCNLDLCHLEAIAHSTDHTDLIKNLVKYAVDLQRRRDAFREVFYPRRLPECPFKTKTQDPNKYWTKVKANAVVTRLGEQYFKTEDNKNVTLSVAIDDLSKVFKELKELDWINENQFKKLFYSY